MKDAKKKFGKNSQFHKDGNHLNNELENLELLCPNCHALTENWRGKNKNKKDIVSEE